MILTRDQARALDARAMSEFGVPGLVLMENAGRNIAELLLALGCRGPVAIVCGRGNNGGDGFVIARHLDLAGVATHSLLIGDPTAVAGDAAVNLEIVRRAGLPLSAWPEPDLAALGAELARAEWVVDALLGSGLRGVVKAPYAGVIATINASPARVLAVDIPSGLDADTGLPLGTAVRARVTATVAATKAGFSADRARDYTGEVRVVGMGAPRRLLGA